MTKNPKFFTYSPILLAYFMIAFILVSQIIYAVKFGEVRLFVSSNLGLI